MRYCNFIIIWVLITFNENITPPSPLLDLHEVVLIKHVLLTDLFNLLT